MCTCVYVSLSSLQSHNVCRTCSCVQRLSTSSPPNQCISSHPQRYPFKLYDLDRYLIPQRWSEFWPPSSLPIQGTMASSAAMAAQVAGPSKNSQPPPSKAGGGPLAGGKSSKAAIKVCDSLDHIRKGLGRRKLHVYIIIYMYNIYIISQPERR